ncbi:MAG TPA: hypothetical protein VGF45_17975 [Polyangia bacterium]
MRSPPRSGRRARWLVGAVVALGLTGAAVARAADSPVVEIFGGARSRDALALLRGELEVLGFIVQPRPLAGLNEPPALPWIYGRVVIRASDRAQAEVQVFRPRARADQTSVIDLGAIDDAGDNANEGDRNRVLTTLAVRVAELLRALDVQPRPPPNQAPPAPVLESSKEQETVPAAVASPVTVSRPPEAAVAKVAKVQRPPAAAASELSTVVPSVDTAARTFVAPGPFSVEAGIALGSAVDTGPPSVGPIVRVTWQLPVGLFVGATITSLTAGDPLVGPAGQSSLVHAVVLAQLGYRGNVWGGRLLPEVTVGFGAQHLRANGDAVAPNQGVVDELVGFAAAFGGGLGFRIADAWVVGSHLELYRAFPQATVYIGPDAVGEAPDVAGFAWLTLRYLF